MFAKVQFIFDIFLVQPILNDFSTEPPASAALSTTPSAVNLNCKWALPGRRENLIQIQPLDPAWTRTNTSTAQQWHRRQETMEMLNLLLNTGSSITTLCIVLARTFLNIDNLATMIV